MRSRRPLILIIDDDNMLARDLGLLLQPRFDVIYATRSNSGMGLLMGHRPDCVLLDIHMDPHFGTDSRREGLAFVEALRTRPEYREAADTPVMLITGSEETFNVESIGATAVFRKPLDLESLVGGIRQVLNSGNDVAN